jgi:hypothetical protein
LILIFFPDSVVPNEIWNMEQFWFGTKVILPDLSGHKLLCWCTIGQNRPAFIKIIDFSMVMVCYMRGDMVLWKFLWVKGDGSYLSIYKSYLQT